MRKSERTNFITKRIRIKINLQIKITRPNHIFYTVFVHKSHLNGFNENQLTERKSAQYSFCSKTFKKINEYKIVE